MTSPTAAPPTWPYNHRTMAEVMRVEETIEHYRVMARARDKRSRERKKAARLEEASW